MTDTKVPHFEDTQFIARDRRVYLIRDVVNAALSTNMTEEEKTSCIERYREAESNDTELAGLADLLEATFNCKTGLRRIGGTFGSDTTVQDAIRFYRKAVEEEFIDVT